MEKLQSSNRSKEQAYTLQGLRRNTLIFAILMLLLQVGLSLVYGFLISVEMVQLNISSVIVTVGLAILIIAGFGLVFGYTKKLLWSGIGFTFLITALCIEVYPLINDFWVKTHLQNYNNAPDFNFNNKSYKLYLSDRETTPNYYGNSITNALKCALSISIAFSSILGRAGNLQCLIVTLFGIVGFELNRQIVQQSQGIDTFGTYYIFAFGGFMGLMLGLFSFVRERKTATKINEESMKRYQANHDSALHTAFGSLIIFALFPLLSYEIDASSRYQNHSPYSNPVCVIAGMGAGAIGGILGSMLINGYLIARDALHGPIAGAIAVGASSLYIAAPVYAFVAGAAGGIIQSFIQNLIEKKAARNNRVVSTVSWSLFGMQGLIGAGFASGWKAIVFTNTNQMSIEPNTLTSSSQFQFYGGLVSAGIGAAFGIFLGLILLLVNRHQQSSYFQDFYYWSSRDSIGYKIEKVPATTPAPQEAKQPVKAVQVVQRQEVHASELRPETKVEQPQPPEQPEQPAPIPSYQPDPVEESDEFGYSVQQYPAQNPYAYL